MDRFRQSIGVCAVAVSALGACGGAPSEASEDASHDPSGEALRAHHKPNVLATGSGAVEVFVNGVSLGTSAHAGALLQARSVLSAGENVVVLRAHRGGAHEPFASAEIHGAFGTASTSAAWKVKAAAGAEATAPDGAWATLGYDDSDWAAATDHGRAPDAPFPPHGPAHEVWSARATDATVLLRLTLYVPPGRRAAPRGFGHTVTGGHGGPVVTVHTRAELTHELCHSTGYDPALGTVCTDSEPRVIEVPSQVFDFRGTEGTTTASGCVVTQCTAPTESEYITGQLGGCAGKATFPVTFDAAGNNPLLVGSNKTVVGVGADATLKGKGLRLRGGVSNVIVRNLTITEINPRIVWGGDAILLDGADRVWIDHNRFSLIGRQMIVSGFGKASNVTISWNEMDGRTPYAAYCNGAHYWVMLFLGADDTITLDSNWIHHTSGRGPHAGGMKGATNAVHLVNNFYQHVPGFAANPETPLAKLLFEGNYFEDVKTPVFIDATDGLAFAPTGAAARGTHGACHAALGRACVANVASPMPTDGSTFPLDAPVLTRFSAVAPGGAMTPYGAVEVPKVVPHLAGPGHV